MEITVTPKKWYVVSGAAGSTISTPEGVVIATVPDGGQASFYATTYTVEASDDSTEVVEATFKYAPAKLKALGVFGRGETLPAGYLPARFLESTGEQYINTLILGGYNISAEFYAAALTAENTAAFGWIDGTNSPVLARYHWSPALTEHAEYKNSFWCQVDSLNYASVSIAGWSAGEWSKIQIFPAQGRAVINETEYSFNALDPNYQTTVYFYVFGRLSTSGAVQTKASRFQFVTFCENNKMIMSLAAVIDAQGVPCMYDKVTKQLFYNSGSGSFIVGMTVEQARQLGKLPAYAPTKTLTVSLPASIVDGETVTDALVQAALDAAAAKGWTITIQTYTD